MSRPRRLQVLADRPSYEWIGRIRQLGTELSQLTADESKRGLVSNWARNEFVNGALTLEIHSQGSKGDATPARSLPQSSLPPETSAPRTRILSALITIEELASARATPPALTPEILLELDRLLRDPNSHSDVNPSAVLPILEAACYWWTADSFSELHPVEQAAIVHLRLIELRPFGALSTHVSLAAATFFLKRADLPPLVVPPDAGPAYVAALREANGMNTRPMVDLFARSTQLTLSEMIRIASAG